MELESMNRRFDQESRNSLLLKGNSWDSGILGGQTTPGVSGNFWNFWRLPPGSPRGFLEIPASVNIPILRLRKMNFSQKFLTRGFSGKGINVSTEIHPITPLRCKLAGIEENMANILRSKPIYRGKVTPGVGFQSLSGPKEGSFGNWRNA